ncbi:MAG TPA: anaerobic ribonucleoside-triphosphate reductase, partial [Candidatus Hydrogenedentes bacterium]|nr:anaerobic ribonucleoside-triphosphate reductase [Candidatus Hydrogenedentota bacterium]
APPQDLESLLVQLGRFRTQVDAHFAGPVSWDMPHVYLSPFLGNTTAQERQRAAQILLFVLGTDATQRAAKPELTLSWDVPARLARRKAAGPAQVVEGRVYADFEPLAQQLMDDILAIYLQANATNLPLLRFVLDRSTFARRGCRNILVRLAETALASGLLEIEFDRPCDDAACPPFRDGSPVAHVVNLNLARMAFRSTNETALMENLDALVDLAAQAHQEKCAFLERLAALRALGPLVFLAESPAHPPLLDISKAVYAIAVDGLSECIEALCGAAPHQSGDALALAVRVLTRLAEGCRLAGDRTGLRIVPAQARYESSVRRFAALDLRPFPEEARRVAKSDPITQDIHYTAGARVARGAACTPSERALLEGEFQALVSEGALARIELPDMETSPEAVASFIEMAWRRTKIRHLLLERRGAPTGFLPHD